MSAFEILFALLSIGVLFWTARMIDLRQFGPGVGDQAFLFLSGITSMACMWAAFPDQAWFNGGVAGFFVAFAMLLVALSFRDASERLHHPAHVGGMGIALTAINVIEKYVR